MLGYMLISMMNLIFFWKKEHMIDYKVYLRLDLFYDLKMGRMNEFMMEMMIA